METSARLYEGYLRWVPRTVSLALAIVGLLTFPSATSGAGYKNEQESLTKERSRTLGFQAQLSRAKQLALLSELKLAEEQLRSILDDDPEQHTRIEASKWLAIVIDVQRGVEAAREAWWQYGRLLHVTEERLAYERSLALGKYYISIGSLDQAEPLLLDAYGALSRFGQLRSGHLLELTPALVEVLVRRGQLDQAEGMVDQELNVLRMENADRATIKAAYDRYAELFEQAGSETKAAEYRQRASELMELNGGCAKSKQ